ncbi:MAG: division/cell wall cluster transcriptional repressor MraZ [Magnetococcus sp. DMHC-6]
MFLGQHSHILDDKGRISIPLAFRKVVTDQGSDRVILTRAIEPCLIGFTVSAWQKVMDKLDQEPMLDREVEAFERVYAAHACETIIDRQGRILIPPYLRAYAGVEKDVIFAGRIRKFEVWHPERWDKAITKSTEMLADGGRLSSII